MLKKLESFGAKPKPLSIEMLNKFINLIESETGQFPDSYRSFLLHFGISVLFDVNVVFKAIQPSPWADDKGYDSLESLYGLFESDNEYTISEVVNTYKEDFHNQWISIGASSGGNQICICLNGEMYGQIWFWDHEADPIFNDTTVISGMTKIANSFIEFVDILEVQDEQADTSGLKKIELDF
ncbi:SMI1/KNR4 family protein [Mangrovibacter phragmitis]|uniref:SMI1/KNR4 family protein n=1 Tax=Mangrovibacter phragmitis TaxID=1691903 RepID=UPI0035149657